MTSSWGVRTPVLARTRHELAAALEGTRRRGEQVAVVPTMGALHAGHASLISTGRATLDSPGAGGGALVVSIFVNPMQFGAGEDLDRYPRTFEADLRVCAEHGADVVFAPSVDEVYPGGEPQVTVAPGPLGEVLEGAHRPLHYRGVLTVVAKLFGLVTPDVAVFGEKDYQQLVLVRRMVADLCQAVDVVGADTVREPDGLALSSRNTYLDPDSRVAAAGLWRALCAGRDAARAGAPAVLSAAHAVLSQVPDVRLDYLALTAPGLGEPPERGAARLLVAARVGTVRLIDNVGLELADEPDR